MAIIKEQLSAATILAESNNEGTIIQVGEQLTQAIDMISQHPEVIAKFKAYTQLITNAKFLSNHIWSNMWSEHQPYVQLCVYVKKDILSQRVNEDKTAVSDICDQLVKFLPTIFTNIDKISAHRQTSYNHLTLAFDCMKEAMLAKNWPHLIGYKMEWDEFEKSNRALVSFCQK